MSQDEPIVVSDGEDNNPGPIRHRGESKISKKGQRTARRWIFTDFKMVKSMKEMAKAKGVRFIEWANEICPETERHHRQARCQFTTPVTRGVVQDMVGYKVHVDMEMDQFKSHCYCSTQDPDGSGPNTKRESYPDGPLQKYFGDVHHESWGKEVEQGNRSDIGNLYEAVKEGKSVVELFEEHTEPMFKYHSAAEKLRKALDVADQPKFETKTVNVICGPPGTGKSHAADCIFGEDKVGWRDGRSSSRFAFALARCSTSTRRCGRPSSGRAMTPRSTRLYAWTGLMAPGCHSRRSRLCSTATPTGCQSRAPLRGDGLLPSSLPVT